MFVKKKRSKSETNCLNGINNVQRHKQSVFLKTDECLSQITVKCSVLFKEMWSTKMMKTLLYVYIKLIIVCRFDFEKQTGVKVCLVLKGIDSSPWSHYLLTLMLLQSTKPFLHPRYTNEDILIKSERFLPLHWEPEQLSLRSVTLRK